MQVGDVDVADVCRLQVKRGAFHFANLHAARTEHSQLDVLSTPCGLALEIAIATDAHTFQFRGRHVHLDVVGIAIQVDVRVVVCLQINCQHIAVKLRIQVVQRGAVTLHLDVVTSLCVDDVHTAEVCDVTEIERDADALPDDVLLSLFRFLSVLCFCFHLIPRSGMTACAQHEQCREGDDVSVFHKFSLLFSGQSYEKLLTSDS